MKCVAILLAISGLVVVGCSDSSMQNIDDELGRGLTGFMAADSSAAVFVWWTESDGILTGSIYQSRRDRSETSGVRSTESGFTATRELNQLTLTFEGIFGISETRAATISDGSLVIYVPDEGGSVIEQALVPATLDQYNTAVARIRDQVEAERAAARQAELEARQATLTAAEMKRQAYERSCFEHGGIIAREGGFTFSTGTCIVHYPGGDFDGDRVSINLDGSWDYEAEEFDRQICRDLAAAGFNAVYHEDTGVCEGDAP